MAIPNDLSRRRFVASVGCGALTSRLSASSVDDKAKLPVVQKRLEKVFRAPCKAPNDLQATSDGLWILDQVDPNKSLQGSL